MNIYQKSILLVFALISFWACEREVENVEAYVDPEVYNPDWTTASHGDVEHDYDVVFPQDEVNTIEIDLTAQNWSAIRSDMQALYGFDFGSGGRSTTAFSSDEPVYVDVSFTFNGKEWKNVGFRLKGNSSLTQAWGDGNYKLPFRLNFDKFEDSYPAIDNQRFYGFKKLSFSPAYNDASLMREKLTPEIFRMAGIPAAQTAFYSVYINFGDGLKYCGVYTAVEFPDDNMLSTQMGEESGNLYKPELSFATYNASEFYKKNNETENDYSDVQSFVTALNSSSRTSAPEQWRSTLESTFNVDHFLKYLAVNNTIVNWDSYGSMAHNFYLYNHSANKLTWIPWDHNEAMSGSPGISGETVGTDPNAGGGFPGGGGGPGGGGVVVGGGDTGRTTLSLSMNEVGTEWPLINYVVNDEVYMSQYKAHLKTFNEEAFNLETINNLIDTYYTLIEPYAIGTNGEQAGYSYLANDQAFISARTELKEHLAARKTLVESYVP